MVDIVWRRWFEIGHETIDFEHKTFLGLINQLDHLAARGAPPERLARALDEIAKYAAFHFASEESVMLDADYDGFVQHRAHHRALLARLEEVIAAFEGGLDNVQEIITFLVLWFAEHTVNEDLDIAVAIKRRNLKSFYREVKADAPVS